LAELLKPPGQRIMQFYVGSTVFDFDNVGLSMVKGPGTLLFDTSKPGNKNGGHDYGTHLTNGEKLALLEFLKIVGEPMPAH
jgi:hypothetical protein